VLRALVLALHHDAGGEVRDAHGGIRHIDVLAAGAGGAEGVDAQVVQLDIDLDLVVHLRVDEHRSERGVPPRVGVEGRDAHQPVHADLRLQQAVSVVAVDLEGDGLDARALALQASVTTVGKPSRSAQRRYMRRSISAQSWLSVPPAPGWMVTMALSWALSPDSSMAVSMRSMNSA